MTRRELGTLVFKIASLYLWLQGFSIIATVSMNFLPYVTAIGAGRFGGGQSSEEYLVLFAMLVPLILYTAGGWWVGTRAEMLSSRIFRWADPDAPLALIALADAQTLAYSVIGLYLMAAAAPRFAGFIVTWLYIGGGALAGGSRNPGIWRTFSPYLEALFQFAIGALLFLGGGGVARFWHRLRTTTGYPTPPPPEHTPE